MPAFGVAEAAASAGGTMPKGGLVDDAVSALVNLGYGRTEAFTVVSRCVHRLGASTPLGAVIKDSLRELGEAARG